MLWDLCSDPGKGSYWTVDLDAEVSTSRARDRKRGGGGSRSSLGSIKSPKLSRHDSLGTGGPRSPTLDERMEDGSSPSRLLYPSDDELDEQMQVSRKDEDGDGDVVMKSEDVPASLPLKSPKAKASPKKGSRTPRIKQQGLKLQIAATSNKLEASGTSMGGNPTSPCTPVTPHMYRSVSMTDGSLSEDRNFG